MSSFATRSEPNFFRSHGRQVVVWFALPVHEENMTCLVLIKAMQITIIKIACHNFFLFIFLMFYKFQSMDWRRNFPGNVCFNRNPVQLGLIGGVKILT